MKRIKQISIWLIALAGLMTALGAAAQNSGNLTPSLQWNYHAGTQTLSITGTGAMPDYASHNDQPWKAFRGQIKIVTIGNGVTAIGSCAFSGCTALQRVNLRASLTAIGDAAFYACTALQSIALPAGVTAIGERAFNSCITLQSIALPAGLTTIGEDAFDNCVALQSIILPARVTTIGKRAFAGCKVLQSITLPKGVTTIGKYAFAGCTALQQVTVAWDKPRSVPDDTFDGVHTANVRLNVPKGKEEAYRAAPVWKEFKVGDTEPPVPGDGGKLTVSVS
ncbi:leucine-rich repeat domain-containing protein, partial [Tannerella forsythia]